MAEERMLNDEILLGLIKANSGGGGGGTTDYEDLDNKPQIGGVTLSGNKSLSDLGAQEKLTAGMYININSGTISVKRDVSEEVDEVLTLTHDTSSGTNKVNAVLTVGGETIDSDTFTTAGGTFHDMVQISFNTRAVRFMFKYLVASKTQSAGYENYIYNEYTDTFVETIGEESKLIIKSELDTALSGKQDTLTFDDAPTDNSNNPVKSNGIYDALELKQDATDDSLETEAKTIVGAINEHEGDVSSLKSGLTNLDNEVNGDATTYPFADVITIEDAVPANLADCSVKIEPVQDLHGFDHPWVGGAGKNKIDYRDAIKDTTSQGLIFKENTNGYISVSGRNTGGRWTIADLSMLANGNYKIIVTCTDNQLGFRIYNGNTGIDELVPNVATSFEMTSDKTSFTIAMYMDTTGNDVNGVFTVMVVPSTETDATFAPYTNICPITGHTEASVQRTGKNLLNIADCSYENGTVTVKDGLVKINGTFSAKNVMLDSYVNIAELNDFYGKELTFSKTDVKGNMEANPIFFTAEGRWDYWHMSNATNKGTKTLDMTLTHFVLYLDGTFDVEFYLQVELGADATPYVPYAGKTYTIALGDTIYGGTVDFDSGVMTVDRAIGNLADLSWTRYDVNLFTAEVSGKKPAQSTATKDNIVCSCYDTRSVDDVMFHNADSSIGGASSNNKVFVKDSRYDDATDLTTALSGQTFVYELATPTTIQLTPKQIQLLKGQNTLTASTGQISVTVNGVSGAIGAVQEQVNEISANAGGAKLKILKYTGTGTTSYTLDFGDDTPATIMQIIPEPGESVITNNYEYLSGFAWGVPFTYGIWANKSNNLPSNHGGFNISTIAYNNNTCTITGPSASAAANYESQKYAVYYLA